MKPTLLFLVLLAAAAPCRAQVQAQAPATPMPGQVLVTGTLADEAAKAAVLARLRELYGAGRVVDQIAIGNVAVPANWNAHVHKLIAPHLKLISRGQLSIDGNNISVRGEVANEAQRQQIASDIATSLNPTYVVNNGLRVSAAEQGMLDATLDKRIVEFDSGQASITPAGLAILDEMAAVMRKLRERKVEVIGHTDNTGLRASNVALSQARAEAVRSYLATKGIAPDAVLASGQGPDRPVAVNTTADGRARNRRIEFRIAQ
ncbi:OmpA family protein [Janthinobacterium sp. SUN118]|uniref:OmpA family protein n=1 Tax=Janthinobacterium sp. SUN118 TaxID=3004100 RepID=UPI0025B102F4|nr:OmpA family protein [Janthinobacterium sp. SUN118]MDN2709106.1 OmpA family protein [Janthinobacterium sp. SUN118]